MALRVDATATTDSSGEVNVTAKDAANLPVGSSIALTHPGIGIPTDSTSSGILNVPGSFSLEIDANGADCAIHVCNGTTGAAEVKPIKAIPFLHHSRSHRLLAHPLFHPRRPRSKLEDHTTDQCRRCLTAAAQRNSR